MKVQFINISTRSIFQCSRFPCVIFLCALTKRWSSAYCFSVYRSVYFVLGIMFQCFLSLCYFVGILISCSPFLRARF